MSAKWSTIAPLFYRWRDLEVPFDLGCGVLVGAVPEWVKGKDVVSALSSDVREYLKDDVRYALAVQYEADCLGQPDPSWKGTETMSKRKHARYRIICANLAIWVAKPSSLCFGILIYAKQRREGTWKLIELCEPGYLEPHANDLPNKIESSDLESAGDLLSAILNVGSRGTISVALRTLWTALCERVWEVRYLLFWVALEALFGPEDAREISYRMSQRVAFFLGADRESAQGIFKEAKEGYSWRSKAVHGMRLDKLRKKEHEKSAKLMYDAQELVRKTLKKILADPKLVKTFSGPGRERYLDGLPFST
ncbi:hypothetical protein HQ563_06690 [bacterium]|nr:hypothetical protein [bacterium]